MGNSILLASCNGRQILSTAIDGYTQYYEGACNCLICSMIDGSSSGTISVIFCNGRMKNFKVPLTQEDPR